MICRLCGEEIPVGKRFCRLCGCPVRSSHDSDDFDDLDDFGGLDDFDGLSDFNDFGDLDDFGLDISGDLGEFERLGGLGEEEEGEYESAEDTSIRYRTGSFRRLYRLLLGLAIPYLICNTVNDALMTFCGPSPPLTVRGFPGLGALAAALALAALVVWCFFLYRIWNLIQEDETEGTTPGNAIFLNFVPVFNCYWFYVMHHDLAQNLNRFCERRSIAAPKINETLGFFCGGIMAVFTVHLAVVLTVLLKYDVGSVGESVIFFVTTALGITAAVLLFCLYAAFVKTAEAILAYKKSGRIWDVFGLLL